MPQQPPLQWSICLEAVHTCSLSISDSLATSDSLAISNTAQQTSPPALQTPPEARVTAGNDMRVPAASSLQSDLRDVTQDVSDRSRVHRMLLTATGVRLECGSQSAAPARPEWSPPVDTLAGTASPAAASGAGGIPEGNLRGRTAGAGAGMKPCTMFTVISCCCAALQVLTR